LQLIRKNPTSFSDIFLESGIGCGTIRMHPDHVIQVQSNNFPIGNYYNNDACTWTFTVSQAFKKIKNPHFLLNEVPLFEMPIFFYQASDCDLSVYCPCFDVPSSFGCLEDYLKIGYLKFHDR